MVFPVYSPSEALASLAPSLFRDVSTTRQTVTYPAAQWATVSYRLLPGATPVANQMLKVVVNAVSDADAAGKLATDGAFVALVTGDDITFSAPSTDPITRIDFATEQAVGGEKTIVQILAGV